MQDNSFRFLGDITHRYRPDTVSSSADASQAEKTNKMVAELEEYEREVLYPLATEQMEIDLDDGVKVSYPKFGAALKKISGLR